MTPEVPQSIPDTLLPLYEATTAHTAVSLAMKMLQLASAEEQANLLNNHMFIRLVESALDGLDSCRKEHLDTLIDSIFPQNQVLAHQNLD